MFSYKNAPCASLHIREKIVKNEALDIKVRLLKDCLQKKPQILNKNRNLTLWPKKTAILEPVPAPMF